MILLLVAWLEWNWGHEIFSHICHQKGDRCLTLGGTALPVCTFRCFGIYLGIVLGCVGQLFLICVRISSTALWAVVAGATFANGLDVLLELMQVYTNLLSIRPGSMSWSGGGSFRIVSSHYTFVTNQNRCSTACPAK